LEILFWLACVSSDNSVKGLKSRSKTGATVTIESSGDTTANQSKSPKPTATTVGKNKIKQQVTNGRICVTPKPRKHTRFLNSIPEMSDEAQSLPGSSTQDTSLSPSSNSRIRTHLATYPLIAKPYSIVNSYTPFQLPSRIINSLPGLPASLDQAVDQYLTLFDTAVDTNLRQPVKKSYENIVVRPREVVKTGVGAYVGKGMELVAGGLRLVEEKVEVVGEYLLPEQQEASDVEPRGRQEEKRPLEQNQNDPSNEYGEEESSKVHDGVSYKAALLDGSPQSEPGAKDTGEGGAEWPADNTNHDQEEQFPITQKQISRSSSSSSKPGSRSSSISSNKPIHPRKELENLTSILQIYAIRAYERNANKNTSQLVHDAYGLTREEFLKAKDMVDKQWSVEKTYVKNMMTAGSKPVGKKSKGKGKEKKEE